MKLIQANNLYRSIIQTTNIYTHHLFTGYES